MISEHNVVRFVEQYHVVFVQVTNKKQYGTGRLGSSLLIRVHVDDGQIIFLLLKSTK